MSDNSKLLDEVDRCHSHIRNTRALIRAICHSWDQDCGFYSCVIHNGTPAAAQALYDLGTAIFMLRDAIMDFPLLPNMEK
ncbi:MAG: hypothetical protein IJ466_10145 [Clostridia bacterium]|nr:hypothetical protein [Clostridia bacterium]